MELRHDFHCICEDDEAMAPDYSKSFAALRKSKEEPNSLQYHKLKDIQAKLVEYNTLLLQVTNIARLEQPAVHNLAALQEYLRDSKGGNSYLQGIEAFIWDQEHAPDLIAIRPDRPDQDAFSRWLTKYPVLLYHRLLGHRSWVPAGQVVDEESGAMLYRESGVDKLAKMVSITLASTIPMIAILVLYFEKNLLHRIYISIGITAAFAALLSMFTNARRIEIFAATASLAAVEVVFIGSAEIN
ncbi:hypothetical protein E8E14_005227 [Neopestalotiopsis sp. 37M]|nr:hypothetical protein E8E14_005227 [Neopestalotiopsis sp. 37M]